MKNILVFPMRGDPPPVPEGYIRDPGNPFVLHLKWIDCLHRDLKKPRCEQCKTIVPWCDFFDELVTPNECLSCQVHPKTELPVLQ